MPPEANRFLLALPAAAVVAAALGLYSAGRGQPVLAARVRGGPTEGARSLSFRVELRRRLGDSEKPWSGPFVVELRPLAQPAMRFQGKTDADGNAEVALNPLKQIRGPLRLRIFAEDGARSTTEGVVRVKLEDWAPRPPGDAAWVSDSTGALTLRAAALRGAFAVPFEDALVVEARRGERTAPRVALHVVATGATPPTLDAVTEDSGRAVLELRPTEHSPQVVIRARAESGDQGSITVSLPVVAGALRAEVKGCPEKCALLLSSPIARDKGYVAVVTETGRVSAHTVSLRADDRGGVVGELSLSPLPSEPLWAVVSSEPDLRSPAVVGWPVDTRPTNDPRPTFEVHDVLWIDGMVPRVAEEVARAREALRKAAVTSGAMLFLVGLLVAWHVRRERAAARSALSRARANRESADSVVGPESGARWLSIAAMACLVLAVAMMTAGLLR